MDTINQLASTLGLGMLAGVRLYATVFAIGLMLRLEWITLPTAWQHATILSDTRVLIVSGVACAIEFVADKIPWVDTAWDSIHTFIRPIGAVFLASSLISNVQPAYQVVLFLLAGGVALSGHSAKAAARLAVNHIPEPFSNVALSLSEDAFVAGGLYVLVKHPWAMAALSVGFLGLFAWFAPRIYRALRAEKTALFALLRYWAGDVREPQLDPVQERWLAGHLSGREPRRLLAVIATEDVKGLRNAVGTVCLTKSQAVFFFRRWRCPTEKEIGPLTAIEAKKGILVDGLVLVGVDGQRTRFDLLAGQMEKARDETLHSCRSRACD